MITAGFLSNIVRPVGWVTALEDHQLLNLGIEAVIDILCRFFTDLVTIVRNLH